MKPFEMFFLFTYLRRVVMLPLVLGRFGGFGYVGELCDLPGGSTRLRRTVEWASQGPGNGRPTNAGSNQR